jgi:hypothetical protein
MAVEYRPDDSEQDPQPRVSLVKTTAAPADDDFTAVEDRQQPEGEEQARKVAGLAAARTWARQRKETVREDLAEQRARVAARLQAWFAAADLSDAELATAVTDRKLKQQHARREHLAGEVTRLRIRLAEAQARKDQPGGEAAVHRVTGELAAAEARMEGYAPPMVMPPTKAEISRERATRKALRAAVVVAGVIGWFKGVAVSPLALLGTVVAVPIAWWMLSRPTQPRRTAQPQPTPPSTATVAAAALAAGTEAAPGPTAQEQAPVEERVFDAPPPPALSAEVLDEALRATRILRPDQSVTVLAAPAWGDDGTATTVFDLPPGVTVKKLQDKVEDIAGALGRDVSMVDITKAGAAGRASLWMSDDDPFEKPRRSPLVAYSGATRGGIDVWQDGIPVAWEKRGRIINLPLRNSSFLIGGMTRSGKGVGMSNLVSGACLDVRVNLRIVAGKLNGEFDPYAKVAATYFKQNPRRLAMLIEALKEDMDRRNVILGQLGKSKLTPQTIAQLGGLELLVVDELATFTAPDSSEWRDDILEGLMELAAVAASAGIYLVLTTQYPDVNIVPQRLAMNLGTRWAMRVDNAAQSNTILGGGASGAGRDASKFDPPRPGLGWLVNPFAGITDLARSFDLDEDERGEVTQIITRAHALRETAGRLPGQWQDPIETFLVGATGQTSAGGGPAGDGRPGRPRRTLPPEQRQAYQALEAAVAAAHEIGRDAQLAELAARIGDGMTPDRLGELLRAAGAGGTEKITTPAGRVNGYRRAALEEALRLLDGA